MNTDYDEIDRQLRAARAELPKAKAKAEISLAARQRTAEALRNLRDREADFAARQRDAQAALRELRGRALLDGTAIDAKEEMRLALEVARLGDAAAFAGAALYDQANREDWRALSTYEDDTARVVALDERIRGLEEVAATEELSLMERFGPRAWGFKRKAQPEPEEAVR